MRKQAPGRPRSIPLIKADHSNIVDVFCELLQAPKGQEAYVDEFTQLLLEITHMPPSDHNGSQNQQAIARAIEQEIPVRKEMEEEEGGSRSDKQIA